MNELSHLSKEDKELASKAMWTTAFEATMKSAKDSGLDWDSIMVGMVTVMTTVIRELFRLIREDED